ncbi:hypothetical protein SXM_3944 [Shewanella xiamenensis]|nr:hypothetical protein SXM_3944 [Shewanella xiamenensis]
MAIAKLYKSASKTDVKGTFHFWKDYPLWSSAARRNNLGFQTKTTTYFLINLNCPEYPEK